MVVVVVVVVQEWWLCVACLRREVRTYHRHGVDWMGR